MSSNDNESAIADQGFDWDSAVLGGPLFSLRETASYDPLQALLLHARGQVDFEAIDVASTPLLRGLQQQQLGRAPEPIASNIARAVWAPLSSLSVFDRDNKFENSLSRLLSYVGMQRMDVHERRYLENLIFQPLQNAWLHGLARDFTKGFAGCALRVIDRPSPATPSLETYEGLVGRRFSSIRGFLEVLVHDDGPGIGQRFAASRMGTDYNLEVA